MTSYLRLRNGHYYFRLRTPSDLRDTIQEPEILKSLRTKDRKSASLAASCLLPGVLQVFTLTRTGFISQEQATERLNTLLERKQSGRRAQPFQSVKPPPEAPSPLLSAMIEEYINDKKSGWTGKNRYQRSDHLHFIDFCQSLA